MPRICLRCCWPTAVPIAPGEVPVNAIGLSRQTFSSSGLEPQSIAFFSTAGSDLLNSGITTRNASARRHSSVNLRTDAGRSTSRSPLYMGRSPSGISKYFRPGGDSSTIALASFRLIDSRRRLPTIRPTWWATLVMGRRSFGLGRSVGVASGSGAGNDGERTGHVRAGS